MNLEFYNLDLLEKELEKLPLLHRIAFAASICERMLPIYNVFSQQEGWGDPTSLRIALDEVWEVLQAKPVDEAKIRQLIDDCENAAPHSDYVMQSRYDFEAQLTCSAIRSTLEACIDCNSQHFIDVMEFVRDIINGFLTSRKDDADPNWYKKSLQEQEEYVSSHALAKQEIAKEQEDLQRLREVETLDREFLESLRTSFNNSGRSLIDLS
ncbi:DUF416 family protein [Kamptonema animale CS-326]|jgi:uncharacterized protein YjaG (DUF416 family)|uniref:DUF416 family protein n=1 Tax=Kamptonema animale TaxID=92934 RepID=UPI00232CDB71|nr:DUF416 family protein [Kamptonema animale]MDB9514037.1 DUF416 family protein [Kamptonema animale CS-326]